MIFTNRRTIELSKIKIPKEFELPESRPNPEKVIQKTISFFANCQLSNDKYIDRLHVDKDYVLFDDYITYLILKVLGKKKVKVLVCSENKGTKKDSQ